jgi:hypothetical protein
VTKADTSLKADLDARLKQFSVSKHFVTFYSPGTFLAETSEYPIDAWDTAVAMKMADRVTERHNATPYAFRFTTRSRTPEDLDSHVTATSPFYFLGGTIETLAEVEARNDPKESTLRSNMRGNGYDRVVVNGNSWKWVQPLEKDDVVLDYKPPKKRKDK